MTPAPAVMPKRPILPLLAPLAFFLIAIGVVALAAGSARWDWCPWSRLFPNIASTKHPAYLEECGSCHLAYPPGTLPADSWNRILAPEALADHYGEDASMPDALVAELRTYLQAHAADASARVRERAFAVPGAAGTEAGLPRITDTPYFIRKHHRIPEQWVTGNPEVGSFSQCDRCHIGADRGIFNERRVKIPGLGRWKH